MSFDEFWEAYPRHVAKKAAEKAWRRLALHEQVAVMDVIQNHCEYWRIKETDKEFIPHPATWLNQGRWEDELDLTPKQKKPPIPWYSTDQLTLAKGQEIGLIPRPGETMPEYRQRISQHLTGSGTETRAVQVPMPSEVSVSETRRVGFPRLSDILKRQIPGKPETV